MKKIKDIHIVVLLFMAGGTILSLVTKDLTAVALTTAGTVGLFYMEVGHKVRLTKYGKATVKKAAMALVAASVVTSVAILAVDNITVTEDEVEYVEVHASSFYNAIVESNPSGLGSSQLNDLVYLAETKNGVKSGTIQAGMYLIPVIK